MRAKAGDLVNGKYRLVRLIGDGGMGSVFEARHEYLGTDVALKFLHPELARRPGLVARFLREARLAASIRSHHIAHVTDVDQTSEGNAYLVMELLQGRSLQSVLEQDKKLPLDLALDYTMQMLAGLEAAHARGVVHRDLKPDNVFVVTTPRGPLVKLLDFGIAKLNDTEDPEGLTRPGVMMGTPEYMAPEQAYSAKGVDARADVYSVGAVLYEMLTGKRPAQGDDPQQIAAFILAQKVPRLSEVDPLLPRALTEVVHRAMAPDPAARFASVEEMRSALLPFCGALSLAGRLAVTPAPGGVAKTLPPEDEPPAAAGGPGQGSLPVTPAATPPAGAGSPSGTPPAAGAGYASAASPAAGPYGGAQGPYGPYGGAGAPHAGGVYGSGSPPRMTEAAAPWTPPPAVSAQPPPPRTHEPAPRRSVHRFSTWLLAIMVLSAIGIVALALTTAETSSKDRPVATVTAPPAQPAATTTGPAVTAAGPATAPPRGGVVIPPPIQPPPKSPPPTTNRPPAKPPPVADAAPPAEEAGLPGSIPGIPQFPFPLPSVSLPLPLPIPIPSGFPPLGLPGFPPAPAPSASPP